jgi:acetyl esterase/lipase
MVNLFTAVDCAGDQLSESAILMQQLQNKYRIYTDLTYYTSGEWEAKLDLYYPKNVTEPPPVLIYYHGGGWDGGSRKESVLTLIPYLDMGFAVVNVDYRLTADALAPAAVIDCRCALRWVIRNSEEYYFDSSRVVLAGHSAGGHLALMTGMQFAGSEFDNECEKAEPNWAGSKSEIEVAAIINWYGISDVSDLLGGANEREWARAWVGEKRDRKEIAKRLSPKTYVREALPPIITIHGGSDHVVPYSQSVQLHAALHRANAPEYLVMVPGGKHGNFNLLQSMNAYREIENFLKQHGVLRDEKEENK